MRRCIAMFGCLVLLTMSSVHADEKKPVVVEGVVTYTGPIPKGIAITETNGVRELVEVDAKTKGLKDAFVWLEGVPLPKDFKKEKHNKAAMDQRNYVFLPHVLSVVEGQEVVFSNNDARNHCVQANGVKGENSLNFILASGATETRTFVAVKGAVQIKCPIHASMGAWIKVYNHPFHTVTDKGGAFKLPPIPPGKYTLNVQHLDGGMKKSQEITVKEGTPLKLTIEFDKNDLKVP